MNVSRRRGCGKVESSLSFPSFPSPLRHHTFLRLLPGVNVSSTLVRTPPGSHSAVSNAAVSGCTTERLNTHKTDGRRVFYAWHPFYGREVYIKGKRNRRGTAVFVCGIEDVKVDVEVPAWMFDPAACCGLQAGSSPRVTVPALRSLRQLLDLLPGQTNPVIKAQQLLISGDTDAQTNQNDPPTVSAVSARPSPVVTSGRRPSSPSAPGAAPASACPSHSRRVGSSGGHA